MNKKVFALIGFIITLIGGVILIMDEKNSTNLPELLKGTGLWVLLFGSSFSLIYSYLNKNKKD